ncbi:MAG: ribonuclease III [Chlamydiales bacterium]
MQNFFSQISAIEERLDIQFRDPHLLLLAFTHRSFWNENRDEVTEHNERLEFLGDSVLGLLIAEHLYTTLQEEDEGTLSQLRAQMVEARACAAYLQKLGLESYLLLGRGEQMNAGKGRESILADLFEALMGALFLDQGMESTKAFFLHHFIEDISAHLAMPMRNWKAELQDYCQKNHKITPLYEVLEESGPAHNRQFYVVVWVGEKKRGEGRGSSKKEAQAAAAQATLEAIENDS